MAQIKVAQSAYIALAHLLSVWAIIAAPARASPATWLFAAALVPWTQFGVTAGAHRLWAHRSFRAGPLTKTLLFLLCSVANQGSIWRWARDHRVHHRYVDTAADPHDSTRGLWYSHIGWLFLRSGQETRSALRALDVRDLEADPWVRFQRALDPWWNTACCFLLPTVVASCGWGEDAWTAFLVAGVLRYTLVLHSTFLVNSLAHYDGGRPYDPKARARESTIVALLTMGEGWHNWHHKYPFDYAAAEHHWLHAYNPTMLMLDALAAVNGVYDRKRAVNVWKRERAASGCAERQGAPGGSSVQS
jgi:stearoyl-CoA desaturase (delta-9 desaturase)